MLKQGGCELELTIENKQALMHSQFRRLEQGKGPAVVEALGQERAESLLRLCETLRAEGPRIISFETGEPIEGTQGRGERQSAADLLALGVFASEPEKVRQTLGKLNTRIWKGARIAHKDIKDRIDEVFENADVEEPEKTVASVLPENLHPIWMFLTGRGPEEK